MARTKKNQTQLALTWLAQASNKESVRAFMVGIFFEPIEGDIEHVTAIATNGRILHMATLSKRQVEENNGIIDTEKATSILKVTKKDVVFGSLCVGTFPNYRRVLPNNPHTIEIPFDRYNDPNFLLGKVLVEIQDAGFEIPRIDPKFMEILTNGGFYPSHLTYDNHAKAIEFYYANDPLNRRSIIMPMRRKQETT